jgi:putative membrane protein (TIGR04086 family)
MTHTPRIVVGAVVAGVISFVVLYVTLALGLVFALSLLPDSIDPLRVQQGFKLIGLLALLFPGYAAARIAGRNGLLHGLLTGACAAGVGALFLVYTFSWEGTYREAVWLAIARTAGLAVVAGCVGGLLGDWRNRSHRN